MVRICPNCNVESCAISSMGKISSYCVECNKIDKFNYICHDGHFNNEKGGIKNMVFKIIVKESRGSNILPENCISVTKTYVQFGSMYNAFFKDYSFIEVFKDEENFLIAFLPSANGDKGFSKRGGKRCTLSSRVSSHILNGRYVPSEMTNENGDKMLVIKTQKTI